MLSTFGNLKKVDDIQQCIDTGYLFITRNCASLNLPNNAMWTDMKLGNCYADKCL